MNTAHHHHPCIRLCSLTGQSQRVANEISNILYVTYRVIVSQDNGILLFTHSANLCFQFLLQSKDGNQQYLLGGPAFGSYGNGNYAENPRVWGLEVVQSAAVPQGKAAVGAFRRGASVITKAGEGLRLEVSNSNEDDFVKNMVTVRLEERVLLAVRMPEAFEIIGQ